MSKIIIPTMDELKKRRQESLAEAEKAISEHPEEYREIKKMIRHIVDGTVDIDDYYKMAKKLSRLLDKMTESGTKSVFCYFYTNIDPQRRGQSRYFRTNCIDLEQQLKYIDQLRYDKGRLRIVR